MLHAEAMVKPPEKKREGRAFSVRLTDAELEKIDELRRAEADLPSRGAMIKRLVARAEPVKRAAKKKSGD